MKNQMEIEALEAEIKEMLYKLSSNANLQSEEQHQELWNLINKQSELIGLIKDKNW